MRTQQGGLVCPGCGERFGAEERFCPRCSLPLVSDAPAREVSERQRRARKVKPQLSEAEFIQGLLLEEGVPSMLRRSAGFDVPDFLAAGPRDILVAITGLDTAREVLLQAELIDDQPGDAAVAPVKLLAWLIVALVVGALLVWLASLLVTH